MVAVLILSIFFLLLAITLSPIFLLLFLHNCTAPGSAFLGPTFTGVKTGSVYQTSLSYGSGKAFKELGDFVNNEISNSKKIIKLKKDEIKSFVEINKPNIVITLNTFSIKIDEILEEEPLP